MPETQRDLYAASVNPPRRAKRPTIPTTQELSSLESPTRPSQHRPILPMRPYAPRPNAIAADQAAAPPPPAKRGRKPGPLSRSAREAQRRLNHSIIEKARRTKINDALATLKQLVPSDSGQQKRNSSDSRDEEDEEDDDYEEGGKKVKFKSKGTGKKEEKEKEFKLEILIRTVSFLQDLLVRVETLEANAAAPCSNCGAAPVKQPKKRKRNHQYDDEKDCRQETDPYRPNAKTPRHVEPGAPDSIAKAADVMVTGGVPVSVPQGPQSPNPSIDPSSARLPSISSWLPNSNSVIDPQLLSGPQRSSPPVGSYLPSPPSSTHFDPIRASTVPPMLNLGPVATAAMVPFVNNNNSSPNNVRTPEDESAASLLLQISASSPTFRPVNSASSTSPSSYGLPDPSNFLLHSDIRTQRGDGGHVRHAQTPSSLLGMKTAGRKH